MTLALLSLVIGPSAAAHDQGDAVHWRSQRLETMAEKLQNSDSDEQRREYLARESWLRRWQPGQMPGAPRHAPVDSQLVEEPLLENLMRPPAIESDAWQQLIESQTRLLAVDTDDDRKEKLRVIIEAARKSEQALSEQLPSHSQQLEAPTGWVLAYVRYRLGRALAYRELSAVRERWPISNPDQYEQQLSDAYQRLITQVNRGRPEFILLEDRMLRRSGKKGQALELLEANRESIEPKWYLKKRRDLLRELGWDPPHQEAARLYLEAGYRDES